MVDCSPSSIGSLGQTGTVHPQLPLAELISNLSLPIFLGSLISYLTKNNEKGTIFASGLITGEAIMGILVAVPIFLTGMVNWWKPLSTVQYDYLGFIFFLIILIMLYQTHFKKHK